jgi:hypothetical protein
MMRRSVMKRWSDRSMGGGVAVQEEQLDRVL